MAESAKGDGIRGFLRGASREPLIQFLLIGLLLFVLYDLVGKPTDDVATGIIRVDRPALLEFMQMRDRKFDESAGKRLDAMPSAEVSALVDRYVREEAMYREAVALGLGEDDYLIRMRLVQSLDFLLRSPADDQNPSAAALRKFYDANRSRYAAPAAITFSHVFFSADLHGWQSADALARAMLTVLSGPGGEARLRQGWPGDRFAYNLNYADRDRDMVAAHFGPAMAKELFATPADPDKWQGPFRSDSGVHLVRIERVLPGQILDFATVKDEVLSDYIAAGKEKSVKAVTADLVKSYDVMISAEIERLLDGQPNPR